MTHNIKREQESARLAAVSHDVTTQYITYVYTVLDSKTSINVIWIKHVTSVQQLIFKHFFLILAWINKTSLHYLTFFQALKVSWKQGKIQLKTDLYQAYLYKLSIGRTCFKLLFSLKQENFQAYFISSLS